MFSSLSVRSGLPVALFVLGVASQALAEPGRTSPPPSPVVLKLGTKVSLACANPGSHQDVSKTPTITNTSGATLRSGMTISWRSSDGDQGTTTLGADVAVGGEVHVLGKPGNAYSCTADFMSAPDLVIDSAKWVGANQVTISWRNTDPWVDAGPSVIRIEARSCASQGVLQTHDLAPFPLAKMTGQATNPITIPFSKPPGSYLRVTADATQKVIEKNETNNSWEDMDVCVK